MPDWLTDTFAGRKSHESHLPFSIEQMEAKKWTLTEVIPTTNSDVSYCTEVSWQFKDGIIEADNRINYYCFLANSFNHDQYRFENGKIIKRWPNANGGYWEASIKPSFYKDKMKWEFDDGHLTMIFTEQL